MTSCTTSNNTTELQRFFSHMLGEATLMQIDSEADLIRDDALSHQNSATSSLASSWHSSDQSLGSMSGTIGSGSSSGSSLSLLNKSLHATDATHHNNNLMILMSPSLDMDGAPRTISLATLPSLNRQSPISRWDAVGVSPQQQPPNNSHGKEWNNSKNNNSKVENSPVSVSSISPPFRPKRSTSNDVCEVAFIAQQQRQQQLAEEQRQPSATSTTTTSVAPYTISPMSPASPADVPQRCPARTSSVGGLPCISLYEEDDDDNEDDDDTIMASDDEQVSVATTSSSSSRRSRSSSSCKSKKSSSKSSSSSSNNNKPTRRSSVRRSGSKRGSKRERRRSDVV